MFSTEMTIIHKLDLWLLYKTFSRVHYLLIMPLEILSSVLLSLSNPKSSHDVSLLCPQMLIFMT